MENTDIKQMLLDMATEIIVDRSKKNSLQKKIVELDITDDYLEITWLNKNGSYFTIIYRENKDPKTKQYASLEFATKTWTKEEYENIEL